MSELKTERNSIIQPGKQPNDLEDVSMEDIDFSLTNHIKHAFSCVVVSSFKCSFLRFTKNFLLSILGGVFGLFIICVVGFCYVKFSPIKNSYIDNMSKSYIAKKVQGQEVDLGETVVRFDPESKNVVFCVDKLKIGNVKFPKLKLVPNYIQSLLSGKIVVDQIIFHGAKFKINSSDEFKNISIGAGNSERIRNNLAFIPYKFIPKLCSFVGDDIRYSLKDSKVFFKFGNTDFTLNNFNCALDEKSFIPKNISFSTQLTALSPSCNFDMKFNDLKSGLEVESSVNDLQLKDISKIFEKHKNLDIVAIAKLLESYNLPASGNIKLIFKKDKIDCGTFNLTLGSGTIKHSFRNNVLLPKSWTKIQSGSVVGTLQNDVLSIQKMDLKINNSNIQISGVSIPLDNENDGIVDINGTIELKNIARNDLSILPENIVNACLSLFEKNISSFKLNSLKMDMTGKLNLNNRFVDDDVKISHGVFSIEDGRLPLGKNSFMKNVSALGEISKDQTKLEISKAYWNNFKVVSGSITIDKSGKKNCNLKVEIPLNEATSKIPLFAKFKSEIPFSELGFKAPVIELSTDLSDNLDIAKLKSGKGVIASGDSSDRLEFLWNENGSTINGKVRTKGKGTLEIDASSNSTSNSGHKKFKFIGSGQMLGFFTPFLKESCNGDIAFSSNEEWKRNDGSYEFSLNVQNGNLTIPFVGRIGGRGSQITGKAMKIGDILSFSNIDIKSDKNKLSGKGVYNTKSDEILAFKLDNFELNNSSLKLDFYNNKGKMYLTLLGKQADISCLNYILEKLKKNVDIHASIKLEDVGFNAGNRLKNLQGTLTIRDGKIIDAMCFSRLSDGSKVIIKSDEAQNNIITKITASNAGALLKELSITDSICGGKLQATYVTDKSANSSISALNCEITDIIAKNNEQLTKLVSLTIPNGVQSSGNSVGFNGVVFSLTMNDNTVTISDGRAIGPTICISFDGTYNKVDDYLQLNGISVPVSINNMSNKSIYAPYKLIGSYGKPDIAVNPLASSEHDVLSEVFGVNLQGNDQTKSMTLGTKDEQNLEEKIIDLEEPYRETNIKNKRRARSTIEHGIKIERLSQ